MFRPGILLLVGGVLVLLFSAVWQIGVMPGSRMVLPPPVALAEPGAPDAYARVDA